MLSIAKKITFLLVLLASSQVTQTMNYPGRQLSAFAPFTQLSTLQTLKRLPAITSSLPYSTANVPIIINQTNHNQSHSYSFFDRFASLHPGIMSVLALGTGFAYGQNTNVVHAETEYDRQSCSNKLNDNKQEKLKPQITWEEFHRIIEFQDYLDDSPFWPGKYDMHQLINCAIENFSKISYEIHSPDKAKYLSEQFFQKFIMLVKADTSGTLLRYISDNIVTLFKSDLFEHKLIIDLIRTHEMNASLKIPLIKAVNANFPHLTDAVSKLDYLFNSYIYIDTVVLHHLKPTLLTWFNTKINNLQAADLSSLDVFHCNIFYNNENKEIQPIFIEALKSSFDLMLINLKKSYPKGTSRQSWKKNKYCFLSKICEEKDIRTLFIKALNEDDELFINLPAAIIKDIIHRNNEYRLTSQFKKNFSAISHKKRELFLNNSPCQRRFIRKLDNTMQTFPLIDKTLLSLIVTKKCSTRCINQPIDKAMLSLTLPKQLTKCRPENVTPNLPTIHHLQEFYKREKEVIQLSKDERLLVNKIVNLEEKFHDTHYTFVHGQQSAYLPLEQLHHFLQKTISKTDIPHDFLFLHVKNIPASVAQQEKTIRKECIAGGRDYKQCGRDKLLFLNHPYCGNETNSGSSTKNYVRSNSNVHDLYVNARDIFKIHAIENLYDKYKPALKDLHQQFQELSKKGICMVIAVPKETVHKQIFLAKTGGLKKEIVIKGHGKTNDIRLILETLKHNPEKINDIDQLEFCLPMTFDKYGGLNPESGIKIIPLVTADEQELTEYYEKQNELFNRIAHDIQINAIFDHQQVAGDNF